MAFAADEQQVTEGVDGSRVRIEQFTRCPPIELTDIDAADLGISLYEIQTMPAVRQKVRKGVTSVAAFEPGHRSRKASVDGDSSDRTGRILDQENHAVAIPVATDAGIGSRHGPHQSAREGNDLEHAVRIERHRTTVRRPEWHGRIAGPRNRP